jgi:predicted nucleotidyltransferase
MDGNWKTARLSEALGIPTLDTRYVPPGVLVDLRARLVDLKELGALIIHGSVVRGEASPKSDIDLLAVPAQKNGIDVMQRKLAAVLRDIEKAHRLKLSFSLMVYSGNEDSHFLWEAMQDGVVLFCRPGTAIGGFANTQPVALISYTFKGIGGAGRQKLRRFIFESEKGVRIDRRNRQEYVAPGALLLSLERARLLTWMFDSMGVKYGLLKLWR